MGTSLIEGMTKLLLKWRKKIERGKLDMDNQKLLKRSDQSKSLELVKGPIVCFTIRINMIYDQSISLLMNQNFSFSRWWWCCDKIEFLKNCRIRSSYADFMHQWLCFWKLIRSSLFFFAGGLINNITIINIDLDVMSSRPNLPGSASVCCRTSTATRWWSRQGGT